MTPALLFVIGLHNRLLALVEIMNKPPRNLQQLQHRQHKQLYLQRPILLQQVQHQCKGTTVNIGEFATTRTGLSTDRVPEVSNQATLMQICAPT